ncbi:MAG: hypothetical protein CVV64_01535 [Candidatus Wallbacteria bacterium HGW-Wallbacteria-1]|jgi:hypothetical protein|uniref:LTD domain-containing protein n=1 Tax=Candidatus Wallbacteria bacterium HGW-Wallbacteria-1 TaxID=2013854 RepID=A0A2N1PUV9_9BACT|nr:MAG: hypothetical protein CVV64_01535 [Candidatus Wallbacteria bacterium HGW-Wallbacteria-1]
MRYASTGFPGTPALSYLFLLVFLIVAVVGNSCFAAAGTESETVVLRVRAGATGAGNGSTWNDAYPSLTTALAAASATAQIWVAQGTYIPGTLRTNSFSIPAGVSIFGGFEGTETTLEQRNWRARPTILSGDAGVTGDTNDNCYHVVVGAEGAVIDGFVIRDGKADSETSPSDSGGGFYISNASAQVRNCLFTANSGIYGGGAATANSSTVFQSCIFYQNVGGYGGALALNSGSPQILNSVFGGNTGQVTAGAIVAYTCTSTISNSTFYGNSDNAMAATLASYMATFQLVNTIIWNPATQVEIINNGMPMTVTSCLIRGGVAGISGGGVVDGGGNLNADPLFVSVSDLDGADNLVGTADDGLSLQNGSPCVGTATVAGATAIDIAGTARPSGEGIDIGAYERVQVVVQPAAVLSVDSANGDGYFRSGLSIVITLSFDRAVNVSGVPTLTLETGAIDRSAAYASGSGTSVLRFNYVVSDGDASNDLDYVSSSAITLQGGSITDQQTGASAVLTLPAPGAAGSLSQNRQIIVDTTAPAITSSLMGAGGLWVDLTLDSGIYSSPDGTADPVAADFTVTLGPGTATGVVITGVTVPAGGTPAGSSSLRLSLSLTGIPAAGQTLEVKPVLSALFDRAGNSLPVSGTGPLEIVSQSQGFSISGSVTVNGSPATGITLEVVGVSRKASGADGSYLIENMPPGEFFLYPFKSGVSFTPTHLALTLGPSATAMNFQGVTGESTLFVGGRVTDPQGQPVKGVSVEVDGSRSVLTNASGYYFIAGLTAGNHTLVASRTNYTLSANPMVVNLIAPITNADFTATYSGIRYNISGTVATSGGTAVAGVTMTVAGRSDSVVTSSEGNYVYGGLEVGTYILTPSRQDYTFEPESITFTVGPSSTGRNFTAAFHSKPSGVTGRYVRLTYLNLASSTWFQLNEIKLFDSTNSSPGDLIPIQDTVLSRQPLDGFGKEKLTDGIIAYNGDFVVRNPGTQMVITLDLGSDKTFHGLWTYNDGAYGAAKVRVEYLKEGETWNTIGEYDLTLTAGQPNLDMVGFSSSIVINEVRLLNPSWIELVNGGKASISLKNWMIFVDGGNYTLPDLTLLPGQFLVLNEGSGSSSALNLYTGLDIAWASNQAGFVYLLDPAGKGVDYVKWNNSQNTPPQGLVFDGTPPLISTDESSLGRNSNSLDTDKALDFHVEEPTPGARNLAPEEIEYFTVSGKITGATGEGVQGVDLAVGSVHAVTDSSGAFTLFNLRAGSHTLIPSLAGFTFTPENRAITLGPSQGGADFSAVRVTPPARRSLGGIVYFSFGSMEGVGGVIISANPGSLVTVTGADGRYLFTDMAEGTYTVTPVHGSLTFLPQTKTVTLDSDRLGENFTADVVIQTYSVAGHAYLQAGGGLQGVTMELTDQSGLSLSTLTDSGGFWKIEGLKAGSYRVAPVKPQWEFNPGYADITDLNTDRTGVDFTGSQPYYEIQGYLRDGTGTGVSGVSVEIVGKGVYLTDGIGKFRAVNILPGTYQIIPRATDKSFTPSTMSVKLGPSRTDANFFLVETRHFISGYVRSNGVALPGVTLRLSNGRETITGSGGFYKFDEVVSGTFSLTPSMIGYAFNPVNRTISLVSADSAGNDFDATSATYGVSGKILTSAGLPLQGVTVVVGEKSTATDLNGLFSVTGLASGTWQITPSRSGYTFSPQTLLATVGPDSTANNFSASRTYSVSGRLLSSNDGTPIRTARIDISPGGETWSDDSGNYSIQGLNAGTYQITPSRSGFTFTPASWTFTVSGADLTKDFAAAFLGDLATLYVDINSQTAGDGSPDRPFQTIGAAMEKAQSGTRIIVKPGTYQGAIVMKYGVALTGISTESTVINGLGATKVIQASDQCRIERLTIRGSSGFDGSAGIFCYGTAPRISNCLIIDCYDGILVHDGSPRITNVTAVNNLGYSVRVKGVSNAVISSSIMDRIQIEGGSATAVVSYSDLIQGGYGIDTGVGNIFADPGFMGPSISDYRLRADSPCLNMGDPAAAMVDSDGSRNDMGAFGGPAHQEPGSAKLDIVTLTSTPQPYPGWGEGKLVDGVVTANGDYAVRNMRAAVSLNIDLGSDKTVNTLKFVNDGEYGTTRVSVYSAQTSAPGTWSTVGTFENLSWRTGEQVYNTVSFTAVQARYLILRAETFVNASWFQLNEVEVYGRDDGATDSALLPISHTSSDPGAFAGFGTELLHDGLFEYNSDFALVHGAGYSNINIDLGSEATVDRIHLYNDGMYGAGEVAIYYARASSPSTFSLIGTFGNLASSPGIPTRNLLNCSSVQARFIRIEVRSYNHPQWLQFNEVEVYGKAGASVALVKHSIQSFQSQQAGLPGHTLDRLTDGQMVVNGDYAVLNPASPLDMVADLGRNLVVSEIRHFNDGQYGARGIYLWYATEAAPASWIALGHFNLNTAPETVNMDIIPLTPENMRYLRFRYTEFTGKWFQVNEIEIHGQAPVEGAYVPVSMTSLQCDRATVTGMGSDALKNGTKNYNSEFALRSPGSSVTVTVDFGTDKWISRLDHWNDGAYGGRTMELSFATSSSPDFIPLTTVDSLSSLPGQADLNRIYFSPVTARRVKVKYTAFADSGWLQLSEYEFYGPSATAGEPVILTSIASSELAASAFSAGASGAAGESVRENRKALRSDDRVLTDLTEVAADSFPEISALLPGCRVSDFSDSSFLLLNLSALCELSEKESHQFVQWLLRGGIAILLMERTGSDPSDWSAAAVEELRNSGKAGLWIHRFSSRNENFTGVHGILGAGAYAIVNVSDVEAEMKSPSTETVFLLQELGQCLDSMDRHPLLGSSRKRLARDREYLLSVLLNLNDYMDSSEFNFSTLIDYREMTKVAEAESHVSGEVDATDASFGLLMKETLKSAEKANANAKEKVEKAELVQEPLALYRNWVQTLMMANLAGISAEGR